MCSGPEPGVHQTIKRSFEWKRQVIWRLARQVPSTGDSAKCPYRRRCEQRSFFPQARVPGLSRHRGPCGSTPQLKQGLTTRAWD